MRFLIIILMFSFSVIIESSAQTDSLFINLKNNQVEKIAVQQIQKITFENINSVKAIPTQPSNLSIRGNFPNPFQEQTNIEFEISSNGTVVIYIFDNKGNQIQKLQCQDCSAGKNTLLWNCLDKNNNRIETGVYYYEVKFKDEIVTKKMIMVK